MDSSNIISNSTFAISVQVFEPEELPELAVDDKYDIRSRTFMILLYPDNECHAHVLNEVLPSLDWFYAGRIHDKDPGKKTHFHIVVYFKDARKRTDVAKDLGIEKRWILPHNRKNRAFRYLCHKDHPNRYQYSTDQIFGTLADKASAICSSGDPLSEKQAIDDILTIINQNDGYIHYSDLLSQINEAGLFSYFRRMGFFASKLIEEHNISVSAVLDKECLK